MLSSWNQIIEFPICANAKLITSFFKWPNLIIIEVEGQPLLDIILNLSSPTKLFNLLMT